MNDKKKNTSKITGNRIPVNTPNISKPLKSMFTFPKDVDHEKSRNLDQRIRLHLRHFKAQFFSLFTPWTPGRTSSKKLLRLVGNIGSSTNRRFLIDKKGPKPNTFFVNYMKNHSDFIKSLINHHRYTGYSLL